MDRALRVCKYHERGLTDGHSICMAMFENGSRAKLLLFFEYVYVGAKDNTAMLVQRIFVTLHCWILHANHALSEITLRKRPKPRTVSHFTI